MCEYVCLQFQFYRAKTTIETNTEEDFSNADLLSSKLTVCFLS